MRGGDAPAGMTPGRQDSGGGTLFRVNGKSRQWADGPPPSAKPAPNDPAIDFGALAEKLQSQLPDQRLAELAAALRLPTDAVRVLGPGYAEADDLRTMRAGGNGWAGTAYPDWAWAFPERGGGGRIVGLSLRAPDGSKGFASSKVGARRGLLIPATLPKRVDPVLVVEGATDVAACDALGVAAVGRPSCSGGANDLAQLLKGRFVLVVGERDQKAGGAWPGRDGAESVGRRLAASWGAPVSWTLPPGGAKDIRAWLADRVAGGLALDDADARSAARAELLDALAKAAVTVKPEKVSDAERLVRLALERYRIGRSEGDEAFAVERDGPNVAIMFRGSSDALRSALAREFRRVYGRVPSASALADALTTLRGEALDAEPEPVYLRLAEHNGAIVLDLGDSSGRCVTIEPGRWDVRDGSPVLFRRTALTAPLREPARGGDLADLRGLLNVTDESWPVLVGWLVAALLPRIPHPVLALFGPQGTGKTCLARTLSLLVDASSAPLRSQPRDPEAWALAAAGSWLVVVDNVSAIQAWWSDALCKCVTGDGWVRRRLYTDGELSVVSFQRVVALTSIDAGALRGDLADRLLIVELERIPDDARREERELDTCFAELRPRLLGALLDLATDVLAKLPVVELRTHPRMADFARVLAAVDCVVGTDSLGAYLGQGDRVAHEVVEADPVGEAISKLVEGGPFTGTATELLNRVRPEPAGREWPKSGRGLVGRIRRLVPALRSVGVEVTFARATARDRARLITIQTVRTVRTVQPDNKNRPCWPESAINAGMAGGTDDGRNRPQPSEPSSNRPTPNGPKTGLGIAPGGCPDDVDDTDGRNPEQSDDACEVVEWTA